MKNIGTLDPGLKVRDASLRYQIVVKYIQHKVFAFYSILEMERISHTTVCNKTTEYFGNVFSCFY